MRSFDAGKSSGALRNRLRPNRAKRVSIQADAFNIFNWVRFASPNLNITNANFGRITGVANSPRAVQFNARISF